MEFSLINVNDELVSLQDYPDAKGMIIVFTCNHCPYAIAYESRLIALANKYSEQGVPLIAINSNDPKKYPQDSFENMKIRAKDKSFPFPYLFDETQEVAHDFGAERTPDIFIYWREPQGWERKYRGAIDDNYPSPDSVTERYVEKVVDALLQGEAPPYEFQQPIGCSIKWK